MSVRRPLHRCEVLPAPWPGVYATRIRSGLHYGRHSHGTFGFGIVDEGGHRSGSARGTVDAFAGDVVTTNPGEVHDGRPLGGSSRTWCTVYVEPQVLAGLAQRPRGDLEITRPVIGDERLRAAIRELLAALAGWQAGRTEALRCEEAFVQACGLLLARHTTDCAPAGTGLALASVRQRLEDDLVHPPSLAELAELAGASRFQLLRRFSAAYGCTPHAWLVQQRSERARGLIAGGMALAEAAAAAGFADQSHMNRAFMRQFGFTPGAWRRALQ